MKIEWTPWAIADREEIFDHIQSDNPHAAVRIDEQIATSVERLARFPSRGRPGRVEGTRELVINHTPYVAAYQVLEKTVRILRVLHGARVWPPAMPE